METETRLMKYDEVEGDLIKLAKQGRFDVIAHGCNCFCTMGAGLAPQMAKAFGCDKFRLEGKDYEGDINKLGTIDYETVIHNPDKKLVVVNCYSQYGFRKGTGVPPIDYEALAMCFKKINHVFKGKHIGLPQIGCHLAGGDWDVVKAMIKLWLKDCRVTVVIYNPNV